MFKQIGRHQINNLMLKLLATNVPLNYLDYPSVISITVAEIMILLSEIGFTLLEPRR